MATRLVTVETERRDGEYAERSLGELAKRCWK